jgi:hypothetical protein
VAPGDRVVNGERPAVDRGELQIFAHRRDEVGEANRQRACGIEPREFRIAPPRVVALGVLDRLLAQPDQASLANDPGLRRGHAGILPISSAAR